MAFKPPRKEEPKHRLNHLIKVDQVHLVDLPEGNLDGIYRIADALSLAKRLELDLVEISAMVSPPICKIMDYAKFKFDEKKKEQEKKKNQKVVHLKEVRLGQNIGDHDLEFKTRHAIEFLKRGDRVKAYLYFSGRGIVFKDQGQLVLLKFADMVKEHGVAETLPKMEGKQMYFIIKPKK